MAAPTALQIAAGQVRSLRAMRRKLLDMSARWEDVDQFILGELEDLSDRVEAMAVSLTSSEVDGGGPG